VADTTSENVHVMPYLTGSFNLHSGQAFPKSASGIGGGAGIAFDLTKKGDKVGFMFDLAFQDMRASAVNGSCIRFTDTTFGSADAEHYFQYALFEGFLKVQGGRENGYILLGASLGYAMSSFTRVVSPFGSDRDQYSYWEGTNFGNSFRLDLRGGIGILPGNLFGYPLVLEGRIGYPITSAISDYGNICNLSAGPGDWSIVSLQFNLGVRL
jgi:hypothetical protein